MIKDFETVKNQLKELSTVINNFKSEAVQLKIIELIFKGVVIDNGEVREENDDAIQSTAKTPKTRKSRKNNKSGDTSEGGKKASNKSGKLGPWSAVDQLLSEDYFKTKKSIGEIVEHCKNNLALPIKANEISGKLAALVRQRKLKRERNADNKQYEYSNA